MKHSCFGVHPDEVRSASRSFLRVIGVAIAVLIASLPAAAELTSAELSIQLRISRIEPPLDVLAYPGAGANGLAGAASSVSLYPGSAFAGSQSVTIPLSEGELRFDVLVNNNGPGVFNGTPLQGMGRFDASICVRDPSFDPACWARIPFVFGKAGFYYLEGFQATVGGPFPVTVAAQDFRTGPVSITGGTLGWPALMATGSRMFTENGNGQVQLVTPFAIWAPPYLESNQISGIAELELHFVPEPGMAALLGCGAAALVALGRRRVRL